MLITPARTVASKMEVSVGLILKSRFVLRAPRLDHSLQGRGNSSDDGRPERACSRSIPLCQGEKIYESIGISTTLDPGLRRDDLSEAIGPNIVIPAQAGIQRLLLSILLCIDSFTA